MNHNQEPKIEVVSRHDVVSERMKEYAVEKAARLQRFHGRISRIQIVMDGNNGTAQTVEMILHVDSGATMVAKETRENWTAAVDLLVDKMERQLKKDKERRKDHKKDPAKGQEPPAEPAQPSEPEETYDDVVRRDLKA